MKNICVINTRRTAIRVAPLPSGKITPEWIYTHFPYGDKFNETTHVFSYEIFKTVVFMAAVPAETVRAAVAECESRNVKAFRKETVIDVRERVMFKKCCRNGANRRVFYPLDGGWRVLDISDGLPQSAAFVSSHPDYREEELKRLGEPRGEIVLQEECDWLRAFYAGCEICAQI